MADKIRWELIRTGNGFTCLLNSLLLSEVPDTLVFGRAGKDAGIDACSPDRKHVYQYKYHLNGSFAQVLSDAKKELAKIRDYRTPAHQNRRHWVNVERWSLLTNVSRNANNLKTWDDEIVPEFAKEGIEAKLWGAEELQPKLERYPHLIEAHFEGKNRCFLFAGEALAFHAQDELGELGQMVALIGRDDDLQTLQAFIDGPKRFLGIHGPGGIGKSRFLLEAARSIEESGKLVLFGLEATMTASNSWFAAVPHQTGAVLFLDEPQSPDLIRVLIEQLRAPNSPIREWKIIVAVRSPNDPVMEAIKALQNNLRANPLELRGLGTTEARQLALALVDQTPLSSQPDGVKENLADHLSGLSHRYPIWLAMAVKTLADSGDLGNIPVSAQEIAHKYLAEFLKHAPTDSLSPGQWRCLLRWLAIYGEINRDEKELIDFLVRITEIKDFSKLDEGLRILTKKRFCVRRGINDRLVSIKPDVMADHILMEWLVGDFEEPCPTEDAGQLAELLVAGVQNLPVPGLQTLLKALARAEYSAEANGWGCRFLDPLAAKLQQLAESDSLPNQIAALERVNDIDFARVDDAIQILATIRRKRTQPVKQNDFFGGEHTITHAALVGRIPWILFHTARYATNEAQRTAIAGEMKELFGDLTRTKAGDPGSKPEALIHRMISGENYTYGGFYELYFSEAQRLLEDLGNLNPKDEAQAAYTKVVAEPYLKLQFERMESRGNSIVFHRADLPLKSVHGRQRQQLVRTLQQTLEQSEVSEPGRLLAWELLDNAHRSLNSITLGRSIEGKPAEDEKQRQQAAEIKEQLLAEIRWVKDVLQSADRPVVELKAARGLWKWHKNFDEDQDLKSAAEECEQAYLRNPTVAEYQQLFTLLKTEEQQQLADAAIARLGPQPTAEAIKQFLAGAEEFGGENATLENFYPIAEHFAGQWQNNEQVRLLVSEIFENGCARLHWAFALWILNEQLKKVREQQPQQLVTLLTTFGEAAAKSGNLAGFLYGLYGQPHPRRTGVLTSEDLDYLEVAAGELDSSRAPEKVLLFAHLFPADWKRVRSLVEAEFKQSPPDKLRPCFNACLRAIRYLDLFRAEYPAYRLNSEQFNWILDLLLQIPEIDEIGDNSQWELKELCKQVGAKSVRWLVDAFRKRIALAANEPQQASAGFRIVPTLQLLSDFVETLTEANRSVQGMEEAMPDLLRFNERRDLLGYALPRYVVAVDPHGLIAPGYVAGKLANYEGSPEDSVEWSRYAGHYPFNSQPWRAIALSACRYAQQLTERERAGVYMSLLTDHGGVHSFEAGTRDPEPLKKLNLRRKEQETEVEEDLKPFREWNLRRAQAEYDQTVALYNEEQGE